MAIAFGSDSCKLVMVGLIFAQHEPIQYLNASVYMMFVHRVQ